MSRNLGILGALALVAALAASGCGSEGPAGAPGKGCTAVSNADSTITITCGDGTGVTLKNGENGAAGKDGQPCTATADTAAGTVTVKCPGSEAVVIENGADGAAGKDGKDGVDGQSCTATSDTAAGTVTITCPGVAPVVISNGADAEPCTVVRDDVAKTSTITCPGSEPVVVHDGADGTNGAAGVDGQPCTVTRDDVAKTATITCPGVDPVVVHDGTNGTNGTNGKDGGNVQVANFHGMAFLTSEGEFANNVKYFVKATITGVTAAEDGTVTVDYKVADLADKPIAGLTAVQANIVKLDASGQWVSYIKSLATVTNSATGNWPNPDGTKSCQGGRESNGTKTDLGGGNYRYVFKNKLGAYTCDGVVTATYERNVTHRVSIMMGGHSGSTADAYFDFVPDGSAVATTRNLIPTTVCQKCHGPLFAGHGGDRLTVENCVTCHNPSGGIDPQGGASMDMSTMIHKIHAGSELSKVAGADWTFWDDPATPVDESADNGEYAWWGYQNRKVTWVGEFPAKLDNCVACHAGGLADVDRWQKAPTRAACGACHDYVDWTQPHMGKVRTDDSACATCHDGQVAGYHDWTQKDARNIPEFDIALTVSAPANGKYFEGDEHPVVTVVLKKGGVAIDHTTVVEDASAEGCIDADKDAVCDSGVVGDGLFRNANFYVTGPRAKRSNVLTFGARAKVVSANAGPWDLTGGTLGIKVDDGKTVIGYHGSEDVLVPGVLQFNLTGCTFASIAAATAAEVIACLNDHAEYDYKEIPIAFSERLVAELTPAGLVEIRSKGLGDMFAVQVTKNPDVAGAMFDLNPHYGGTSSQIRKRTNPANNDPLVTWYTDRIEYRLDSVASLRAGTYVVGVEMADQGRKTMTDYRTPSVATTTFQVGVETVEKPPADGCDSCHWSDAGVGYVLDYPRHNKPFNEKALDGCAACHDYQAGIPTVASPEWGGGGKPISKRVHSIHFGAELNYPMITVDHEESVPGRNWFVEYPQDIRNCESCHSKAGTSGTWATSANRLACSGCHDSLAAQAHMKNMVYDPSPAAPYSGDEEETCKACH